MGDVGREPFLPGDALLDGVDHAVERVGQDGEIVVDPLIESSLDGTVGDPASDRRHVTERLHDPSCHPATEQHAGCGREQSGQDHDLRDGSEALLDIEERIDLEIATGPVGSRDPDDERWAHLLDSHPLSSRLTVVHQIHQVGGKVLGSHLERCGEPLAVAE